MASGDIILESDNMFLVSDDSEVGINTTTFHHSTNGVVVTVSKSASGVNETLFDTAKTYDVLVKEH